MQKSTMSKKELTKKELTKKELTKKELTKKELTKKELTKKELTKKELAKKEIIDKKQVSRNNIVTKFKGFQQDNNGLTLVELIIAMTITSTVIAMVILFMSAGSRNYSSANDEVKLQMEAQTVMNQLESILIEANWVEKFISGPSISAYVIYSNTNICAVFYDSTKKTIYMKDGLDSSDTANLFATSYTEEENRMASYITDFNLITSVPNNEVELRLEFKNNSADFTTVHTIAFRNQMAAPMP